MLTAHIDSVCTEVTDVNKLRSRSNYSLVWMATILPTLKSRGRATKRQGKENKRHKHTQQITSKEQKAENTHNEHKHKPDWCTLQGQLLLY